MLSKRTSQALILIGLTGFLLSSGCRKSQAKPGPAISQEQFDAEINSAPMVIVKFGASWCGPCVYMDEQIEKLRANQFSTKIIQVDVDSNPQLKREFEVSSIPRTFLFQNGKPIFSHLGGMSSQEIESLVQKHSEASASTEADTKL